MHHAYIVVHAFHALDDMFNHHIKNHMLVSVVTRGGEINGVRQSSRKKSENFLLVNKHIICNAIHRMKNQKVQVRAGNQ